MWADMQACGRRGGERAEHTADGKAGVEDQHDRPVETLFRAGRGDVIATSSMPTPSPSATSAIPNWTTVVTEPSTRAGLDRPVGTRALRFGRLVIVSQSSTRIPDTPPAALQR